MTWVDRAFRVGEYCAQPPACRDDRFNHLHEQETVYTHTEPHPPTYMRHIWTPACTRSWWCTTAARPQVQARMPAHTRERKLKVNKLKIQVVQNLYSFWTWARSSRYIRVFGLTFNRVIMQRCLFWGRIMEGTPAYDHFMWGWAE